MGLRGPAPQPTALKLLCGNPGKRALNKNEPKPTPVTDPAQLHRPDYLDEYAVEEWDRLVAALIKMGVLTVDNYTIVALISSLLGDWKHAQIECSREPYIITPEGRRMNPWRKILDACRLQIKPLLREVGITPSSRAGVSVVQGATETSNAWEKLRNSQNAG